MVRPKKHLGQHFLTDQNIARKIVGLISTSNATVIEIGAGTGVLTKFLIEDQLEKLHIIEIDEESVDYLHANFPELASKISLEDFLKSDLSVFQAPITIIGNFPYNISSQIFFQVLNYKHEVNEVVCMIQKEVAERLASSPGNKTYGILSVLLQAWYSIEYQFTVGEKVFNPPPKVKSAVIRLKRNETDHLDCNEKLFQQIVKKGFNQRRKTLRNALREYVTPSIIENDFFNKRAEQLSVSDFVSLTNLIESSKNTGIL
ncbi:MAG: dimethyladenosine transferase [Bacteroidetes bacterium]|nr:MAG: dimethyladenosine transferase [Bacteroidota bacterium]